MPERKYSFFLMDSEIVGGERRGNKSQFADINQAICAGCGGTGKFPLTNPPLMWSEGRGYSRRHFIEARVPIVFAHVEQGRSMAKKDKETEQSGEAAEGGASKRKLPIKLIAIAGAGLLVAGGGGFGAYKLLAGHKDEHAAAVAKPAAFFDVPDLLVNLSSTNSERTQYLKVKVVLELPDAKLKDQIKPMMPRLQDAFQTYLRELRATDLDGSAGLYRLKEELTRRVNLAIAPNKVNAVLFKEIVVQ
jgi:flagellar FliL protein